MSSARLLVPLFFLACSLFATGQSQPTATPLSKNSYQRNASTFPALQAKAATPSEPWRIIPQKSTAPQNPMNWIMETPSSNFKIDNGSALRILPKSETDHIAISLEGNSADASCFAIRSYVVARDSNDSEATHPVAYSTCQPASRYRLRQTVVEFGFPGQ